MTQPKIVYTLTDEAPALATHSLLPIIEAFTAAILDKFSISRKKVISGMCLLGFLGSLLFATNVGMLWLDIVDHFLNQYGLITVGIV